MFDRYQGMLATIAAEIKLTGLDESDSTALALLVLHGLAKSYGGERLYIPQADSIRKSLRDEFIGKELARGASIRDLKKRFNLSRSRLYQIMEN